MTTTNTGWKNPLSVDQDDRKELNNGHSCYTWADLKDILRDDTHHAYIPTYGGIDSLRASPVIYAYNYNFKIPENASIKKVSVLPVIKQGNGSNYGKVMYIKLLKLKVGNSLTDSGGDVKNLADSTYVKSTKTPFDWTTEETWTHDGKYEFEGDEKAWDTKLTPAVVNASTFGCVFQVVGTDLKKWVMPCVAKLMMKVEYSTDGKDEDKVENQESEVTTSYKVGTTKLDFENGMSKTTVSGLDVDEKDTKVTVTVVHKHKGQQAESPIIQLKADNLLIGPTRTKTYTLPTIHFTADEKEKEYTQSFDVYPNFIGRLQVLQVQSPTDTKLIRFDVDIKSYSQMSAVEKQKYANDGQFCKITNCTFKRNKSTSDKWSTGGAMYITTEHFSHSGNTYGTGADANTVDSKDGVPNLCYNGKPA